jgi:hypothetical protein
VFAHLCEQLGGEHLGRREAAPVPGDTHPDAAGGEQAGGWGVWLCRSRCA